MVTAMPVNSRDVEGGVRILLLDRPPANAIDFSFLEEIAVAVETAEADARVRAVVVTGNGKCFSAGLDIKAMAGGQAKSMAGFGGADGVFRLWTMRKPTIAMMNGHAIAGGCILALACDFRVTCAGSHRMGLNETAIGLALPTGAFEIARLALPIRTARSVLLEADLYDPETALAMGLVDEVVPASELEANALARARKLGAMAAPAYAANKYAWQRLAVDSVRSEPAEVRQAIADAWTSEETQRAFADRIAAIAKGKG
jgi:enoyl-CoA hydratase